MWADICERVLNMRGYLLAIFRYVGGYFFERYFNLYGRRFVSVFKDIWPVICEGFFKYVGGYF